jgi:hypothetical protein
MRGLWGGSAGGEDGVQVEGAPGLKEKDSARWDDDVMQQRIEGRRNPFHDVFETMS